MHRHHSLGWQQIIQNAEHRFFHLTGVGSASDQDKLFGKVNRNHGFAPATVACRVGPKAGQIDDGIFRNKSGQLIGGRSNQ